MLKYDLAVVGAGLGGLAVAALLSKKNKKVIVLEPAADGGVITHFHKEGFRFSSAPALSFGFEPGGALKQLCSELGIITQVTVLSPGFQVALPDRRLTVYAETEKTLEELAREFPREVGAVTAFYRDLKKLSLQLAKGGLGLYVAGRRSAATFMERYRFSRELTIFFELQSRHFLGRPIGALSLLSLVSLVTTVPVFLTNGFTGFVEQIRNSVRQNGVEARFSEPFPGISYSRKRPAGLMTKQGLVEAKAFLFNTELELKAPVLFLGIRDEVVPVGMAQQVICLPKYDRPDDFFVLCLSPGDNTSFAPKGMRSLTAKFTVSDKDTDPRQLVERICRIMPFLNDYTVSFHECAHGSRRYPFPEHTVFTPLKFSNCGPLLNKTSLGKVYALPDDPWTPVQTICAAARFVERLS